MQNKIFWRSLCARATRLKAAITTRAATPPIGFDLASERLNLAQFKRSGDGREWRAAAALSYPKPRAQLLQDPPAFRDFVRGGLHRHGFRGKGVVSVLPPGDLQVLSMDYTTADGRDDSAILLRTLRERFKEGLDDSVVDILPIRRPPESNLRSAVVAIAPRERVEAHLELLCTAGLSPLAIDIGPAALARLARTAVTDNPHTNLLMINFGTQRSYLSLLWGRRLMFDRSLPFGESMLADTLARNLDLAPRRALDLMRRHGFASQHDEIGATIVELLQPDFQQLAHEIGRVLIYFASQTHGGTVDGIYLAGSLARHPGAADYIGRLLAMPVHILDPWQLPGTNAGNIIEPPAGMAVAAGLALRPLTRHG